MIQFQGELITIQWAFYFLENKCYVIMYTESLQEHNTQWAMFSNHNSSYTKTMKAMGF